MTFWTGVTAGFSLGVVFALGVMVLARHVDEEPTAASGSPKGGK